MQLREAAAPRRIFEHTVHAVWGLSLTGRDDVPPELDHCAPTRAVEDGDPIDSRVRFRLDPYAHEFAADHAEMRAKRARDDIRIGDAAKPLRWRRKSLGISRGRLGTQGAGHVTRSSRRGPIAARRSGL